jgi:hypothetical protein
MITSIAKSTRSICA